jgi:tripartite-type tricarboxylate transporter receptor subunit TctC
MKIRFIAWAAACLVAMAVPASAQAADPNFYAGKTIYMIVGVAPGAGYDLNARALARYMPAYIPGHPTIVVENQPGAASMIMALKLLKTGTFDGLTIGASFGDLPTMPLLDPDRAHFDARKFNWIGSTSSVNAVAFSWYTQPVKTFKDLQTTQLLVGAQAPGTTQYDLPTLANALLGTHFKVVTGYDGTVQILTAAERGEVGGIGFIAFSSLLSLDADWLKQHRVNLLLQWGVTKQPGYNNVPAAHDLAKTPEDKQIFKVIELHLAADRPFFLPPNVPADRVAILRRAFDETMKDPGFLDAEKKLQFDVEPMSGAEMSSMIDDAYSTPQPVLARLRKILNSAEN